MRGRNTSSRLRHRLTLQEEVRTQDTVGGYTRSWRDVAQLWAEVFPVTASQWVGRGESVSAEQIQAVVTHRIVLRYRPGVDSGMRFVFDNRVFNIRSVTNKEEKNEVLEILAEEGVAD